MSTLSNLATLTKQELKVLIQGYFVLDYYQPDIYDTKERCLQLIEHWLKPDLDLMNRNAYQAVMQRQGFDLLKTDSIALAHELFGNNYYSTTIGSVIVDFLAGFPIQLEFGKTTEELIRYAMEIMNEPSEQKRNELFFKYTKEDPNKFLNDIEKIFFVLHGYGLPNKNISPRDYENRLFCLSCKSVPTTVTVLSNFVRLCVTNFSAREIYNKLSMCDLAQISPFEINVMREVKNALTVYSPAPAPAVTTKDLEKFKELLISYGMLPYAEYDRLEDVYETNLTQINDYRTVVINRKFSLKEIVSRPNLFVKSYIATLSDQQILGIAIPLNDDKIIKLIDFLHLQTFTDRERKSLEMQALTFLTKNRYFVISREPKDSKGNNQYPQVITYGKLIDAEQRIIPIDDFISILRGNECLYVYGGLSTKDAKELARIINMRLFTETINSLLEKYDLYRIRNMNYISTLANPAALGRYFSMDVKNFDKHDVPIEALSLAMYNSETNELLSLTFGSYLSNMYPANKNLLVDTFLYYSNILGTL